MYGNARKSPWSSSCGSVLDGRSLVVSLVWDRSNILLCRVFRCADMDCERTVGSAAVLLVNWMVSSYAVAVCYCDNIKRLYSCGNGELNELCCRQTVMSSIRAWHHGNYLTSSVYVHFLCVEQHVLAETNVIHSQVQHSHTYTIWHVSWP